MLKEHATLTRLFEDEVTRYENEKAASSAFKQNFDSFLNKTVPMIFEHQRKLLEIQFEALLVNDLSLVAKINGRISELCQQSCRSFERNTDY